MNGNSEKHENRRRQLFLFHFAGGSRYSFEFMMPFLADFEVIALELPGRGNRINENLTKDFEEAACDFFGQVLKSLKGLNFVLYGHSLGALFAFRVCQLLEQRNVFPTYIVVSGNPGPGITLDKNLSELKRDDFVSELINLGGIPHEIVEDSDTLDFFIPILRSDFGMADYKKLKLVGVINAPIYALMGDKEESVNEITNWKNFTRADFQCNVLDGNHFFIYEQAERIANVIKSFNLRNN
ncbi:thioesterase II family protein [Mucilaginibacter sp. RCC_168]